MVSPFNVKTTKKILDDRVKAKEEQEKIDPELKKMHEIFGDPNTRADIVYDPAKLTPRERFEKRQHTRDLLYPNEPMEEERVAERVHEAIFGKRKSRVEY